MATKRKAGPRAVDMRVLAREQADLVVTYAEDGAYCSAARVARKLANDLQVHADRVSPGPHSQEGE